MIILQTVGLLGRVISSCQSLYLNTGQHNHRINAYTHQTSMPSVRFEPTIPASEREKTVHASDCPTTVTGRKVHNIRNIPLIQCAVVTSYTFISWYKWTCTESQRDRIILTLGRHFVLRIRRHDLIKFQQFKSNVSIFLQNSPRAIKENSKENKGNRWNEA
jgi:hypothetical protein